MVTVDKMIRYRVGDLSAEDLSGEEGTWTLLFQHSSKYLEIFVIYRVPNNPGVEVCGNTSMK